MKKMTVERLIKYSKIFYLPVCIYFIFILIRIKGIQPETESELGDFITSINFIFGSSIAYFIYIIVSLSDVTMKKKLDSFFWSLISVILAFLAFDEIFMIHENIHKATRIRESIIFLAYGALLLFALSGLYRYFSSWFYKYFLLFGIASVISIVSDSLFMEGTIGIGGKNISYEQFSESFGALFLACSVVCLAISYLKNNTMNALNE